MAFTTAINTSLLTTYLVRVFIPALQNNLQFQKFTTPAIVPAGGGNIGRFNVFSSPGQGGTGITTTVTALAEGSTSGNEITTLTTTGVNCTISEYGEFIKFTQLEELAAVSNTRNELMKRFAYGGARTLDSVVRTFAITSTTAAYADATSAGAVTANSIPQSASAAAIVASAQILRDNSAEGFDGVAGHPPGNFAAIVTPKAERQIINEGTTGRLTWGQAYTNVPGTDGQMNYVKGLIGSVYGTTVYRTQNYSQTTVTSLSDNCYVIANGGLGAVAFQDMNAEVVINDVNSPYKNVNSIAYHAFFGANLIDSARVVRLYTGTV